MIGLVDFCVGNIGSVGNILNHLGIDFVHTADKETLSKCDRLLLPGVGAFAPAIEAIRRLELDSFLVDWGKEGKPILGICLGMQLLFEESSENGDHRGLGLIKGIVEPIVDSPRKVHMGWNTVEPRGDGHLINESGDGYFVHSYRCVPEDTNVIAGECDFGCTITAAVQSNSVCGVQFHPEKSQAFGMDILKRFNNGQF